MNNHKQDSIIRGIVTGDQTIIKAFYETHLPQVKSYILKNSGSEDDAEDIFQDAMVFMYEKLENNSLQVSSALGTYVYSVCKNMWMNKLRRNKKMINHEGILSVSSADDADIIDAISEKERKYIYQKYFLKLGTSCQEILSLFFQGMTMKEIAAKKVYSEAYARKKKFECKNKLVKMVMTDPAFDELRTNIE
ncbi:sigma-70 family RNA polymerase sigma factor [Aquimarina sp. MMG016]|uniref:RNA polymerase sigma factor n=1 Tax=Aquimarina sp. MMG016 TaxID=2822690 RepID=UPI001B3A6DDA|nr:sigma-70 family RNA polymerase sigma factor [Aquimarina sp. MMG016]MBQ4820660.1 sigma-70 family RNA polymerase sigma factor [Aquimarina sp. MMG016]